MTSGVFDTVIVGIIGKGSVAVAMGGVSGAFVGVTIGKIAVRRVEFV